MEIYKEVVYDLLDMTSRNKPLEEWPKVSGGVGGGSGSGSSGSSSSSSSSRSSGGGDGGSNSSRSISSSSSDGDGGGGGGGCGGGGRKEGRTTRGIASGEQVEEEGREERGVTVKTIATAAKK